MRALRPVLPISTAVLIAAALLAAVLLAGCAKHEEGPASTLTEHQRDSVLARSSLPGAGVVDRALKVAAREQQRASGMDSLGQ